jgi:exodeoxyribonuclease VII small subunit
VADLTYEQARDELVSVVARLEAGGESLEGSLQLWERGEALAARCQQWLDGARRRLDAAHAEHGSAAAGDAGASGGPLRGQQTTDRTSDEDVP